MSDMRNKSRKGLLVLVLLLLAAVPLLVVGVGWAQESDRESANDYHDGNAQAADMVITDPDADLPAIVTEITGGGGSAVIVPAAAFADDGYASQAYGLTYGGGYLHSATTDSLCVQAPVYLPDGATVNAFSGHVYDNDADENIWRLELRRAAYTNLNGSTAMANAPTSGASAGYQATLNSTNSNSVVDNSLYSYFSAVCFHGRDVVDQNLRLYAVQVFYSQ